MQYPAFQAISARLRSLRSAEVLTWSPDRYVDTVHIIRQRHILALGQHRRRHSTHPSSVSARTVRGIRAAGLRPDLIAPTPHIERRRSGIRAGQHPCYTTHTRAAFVRNAFRDPLAGRAEYLRLHASICNPCNLSSGDRVLIVSSADHSPLAAPDAIGCIPPIESSSRPLVVEVRLHRQRCASSPGGSDSMIWPSVAAEPQLRRSVSASRWPIRRFRNRRQFQRATGTSSNTSGQTRLSTTSTTYGRPTPTLVCGGPGSRTPVVHYSSQLLRW